MSTKDESVDTTSSDGKIYATLIRGRVFFFKNQEFLNGVAQEISASDKEWLEEHAVDLVSVEDENEHQVRQKFTFSGAAPDRPPAKRSRSR